MFQNILECFFQKFSWMRSLVFFPSRTMASCRRSENAASVRIETPKPNLAFLAFAEKAPPATRSALGWCFHAGRSLAAGIWFGLISFFLSSRCKEGKRHLWCCFFLIASFSHLVVFQGARWVLKLWAASWWRRHQKHKHGGLVYPPGCPFTLSGSMFVPPSFCWASAKQIWASACSYTLTKWNSLGLCQTLGVEQRQMVYFVILCLGSVLWVSIPPTKCLVNLNNSRSQYCFSYLDLNLTSYLCSTCANGGWRHGCVVIDGWQIHWGWAVSWWFARGWPRLSPSRCRLAQPNAFCIHQHSKIKKGESRET